jgi:hypothetical protein
MRINSALVCLFTTLLSISSAAAQSPRIESQDFVVYTHRGGPSAEQVIQQCRAIRQQLHNCWLGGTAMPSWEPRCRIVIHASRTSYLQVVGAGGSQTSGSSLVRYDRDKISERRIDLLVDWQGTLPALRHELAHVVLADRFGGRQPPRWADEGIAMLADAAEKQSLHLRDCRNALHSGRALRLADIVRLEQFRSSDEVAAFYGESLSLVDFLVQQATPAQFVAFVELALDQGYDRALRQTYDIDGIAHLERQWRQFAMSRSESATLLPLGNGPIVKVGLRS